MWLRSLNKSKYKRKDQKMKSEKVIVKIGQKNVAEITLNRPENLNTFNSILAEQLYDALLKLFL